MSKIKITNKFNDELNTLQEWEAGFKKVDKESYHWESGYSAHSLAVFFLRSDGQVWLDELSNALFNESVDWKDAVIEHGSKLDSYKGKTRMQDLAIWGTTSKGERIFVGIEAKVVEPFGNRSLRDEYEDALESQKNKKNNSKRPNRIEETTKFFFDEVSIYDERICNLRYQLMYYFRASILEAPTYKESLKALDKRKSGVDIVILPILVFETEHYKKNQEKGMLNKKDYNDFCNALNLKKQIIGKKEFWVGEIYGKKIYSIYENIDLCKVAE